VDDPISFFRSDLPGAVWPAIPATDGAQALALQFQLERSQWHTPEQLGEAQYRQLDTLLRHAYASVPYYRERWKGVYDPDLPLTPERFARLPVLTRRALQQHFEALKSAAPPPAHGAPGETSTSGSTGMPVRVLKTPLTDLVWQSCVLREHLWHRRDPTARLAVIRHNIEAGEAQGWGPAIDIVAKTGPAALLPVSVEVGAQLRWLEEQQPDYLLTYPSNLADLAGLAMARGTRLTRLREARTLGEVVTPELRALCRKAWNVAVVDAYSAQEVDYLGLQCPDHEHYHVPSEFVLVEVLDRRGRQCAPGQTGLVAATPLHNFAMPLVRYMVGDYAEVGGRCPCGRGLPVLARIMGRVRNMLRLASGESYWPLFGAKTFSEIAPVLQCQFVQKNFHLIEARLVSAERLTAEQEERLRGHVLARLPAGLQLAFKYVSEIPRSAGGKYEDFVSEVADPPRLEADEQPRV
jgi:phenylacetate-CoA ligase